jgi:signal transduction histidine kinase
MRRRDAIAALIAGSLIVLGLMAVFAVEISDNQSRSRSDITSQARQRVVLVSGLIDAVFAAESQPGSQLVATYSSRVVADRVMEQNRGAFQYVALLDSSGRLLAHSSGFTALAAASLNSPSVISMIRRGDRWALGDVRPDGRDGVINFATQIATPFGERILVNGVAPRSLSVLTTGELRKVPGLQGQHQLLVDGNGVVIASTNPKRPPGYLFRTPGQLQALSHQSGIVNGRYFDQVGLANTTWKIIMSVPEGAFFASVSGARHWLPWLIFAVLALVGIVAVALARRALRDSRRLEDTNRQINAANRDLGDARASLEEMNGALTVSNQALEVRAQALVRSNEELEQFAAIASHDLQEPLRKVRTFTERVSETEADRLSETGADYLRRANASAERMQKLIEDLLKFSRVATSVTAFAPVDLAQVTAEVLEDLEDQVRRGGAIVRVAELPVISADGPQMRQLIQNLLSNAIKFSRAGVLLEVDVEAVVEDGLLTMVVRDNGIGFDAKYNLRIFQVFERLNGRGAYEGTGIGLALCQKIAKRHAGGVVAVGVPGEGSTFTVTMATQLTGAVNGAIPPGGPDFADPLEQEGYVAA